jgi:hypothetical protein
VRGTHGKWLLAMLAAAGIGWSGMGTAQAQNDGQPQSRQDERARYPRLEVAPFYGYLMGGSFSLADTGQHVDLDDHGSYGLALDLNGDEATQYELFYGRQSTVMRGGAGFSPANIRVEYLHIGGTTLLDDEWRRVKPYLVGTIGATRFSPDSGQGRESTHFSLSIGAGLRVPFNERLSLRLEARGFLTLVNTNAAFFCLSDQSGLLCRVHGRGSTFSQVDLLAGAAYTF